MTATLLETRAARTREARLRREFDRAGYVLRKSRLRGWPQPDDHGEYMILDAMGNFAVAGWHFDYSLDDVEAWLATPPTES